MMEVLFPGGIAFTWEFLSALLSIVLIDLVLAGDNAVVIALAVRNLPHRQKMMGILLGSGAAVLLRIIITFFAAKLLGIAYVKLVGGALILWIAVKLLMEGGGEEKECHECKGLFDAMITIVVADLVMSVDNILAVAGASKGSLGLLIFGLALSIPFVVFTSNLLSTLMERYPIIITIGAAVLGKVGGEMIVTDPFMHSVLPQTPVVEYGAMILGVALVLAYPRLHRAVVRGRVSDDG
ncbi:TerC family protein [Nitratidesulfovibrio sp. D1]|uniref:TerC family protein n=1 Tax=Nitratidesulfovibrio sp. D1 TaxID=3440151 RepID=UPI003EB69A48